jgi:solute carrier family 25 (adenine nucleotide translocator) protein 4/5/6/31
LFVYSLDYTRIRLANDILSAQNERQYKGIVDVYRKTVRTDGIIGLYRKTVRTDGIIGLYRGFPIACAGVVVYRAIYFGLFDSIKHFMPHQHLYATFLLAWGVTTGAALCM